MTASFGRVELLGAKSSNFLSVLKWALIRGLLILEVVVRIGYRAA